MVYVEVTNYEFIIGRFVGLGMKKNVPLVVKLQTVENIDLSNYERFKMNYVRQYLADELVAQYHPNPRDPSQS